MNIVKRINRNGSTTYEPVLREGMLVVSRHEGQKIVVNDDLVITVVSTRGGRVRLGLAGHRAKYDIRRAELPPGSDGRRPPEQVAAEFDAETALRKPEP